MLRAMKRVLAVMLCLTALPVPADEVPIPPAEFREYSEGFTLHFEDEDGRWVGSEAFGKDGEATWRYPDGTCVSGLWKPYGAQICFYYDTEEGVQCWRALRDERGLKVRRIDRDEHDDPGPTYRISRRDRRPLLCGEPSSET